VVVVTKSTVPVGTTKEVKRIIEEALAKNSKRLDFYMANNPEFLREGKAIEDFMRPDRVVVGFEKDEAKKIMENLYSPLTKNGHPIFFLDIPSSEMTKYASNTFIAARISLINEIAQLCELVGADVEKVRMAVGSDKRIGQQYIYPGVGYGGSCFPKDVQALSQTGKKHGLTMPVTDAIEETNNKQKTAFAHKIARELKTKGAKKAALWGLAFKPHTDDMRFAPSLEVIKKLLSAGINISAYDPVAMEFAKKILGGKITYAEDMYEALNAADALIIVTEWPQFKEPDFLRIKQLIKSKLIFDGRNIYSQERMRELGFTYHSIGRPPVH
jgi:UDPglucose 6-dehydrogenase